MFNDFYCCRTLPNLLPNHQPVFFPQQHLRIWISPENTRIFRVAGFVLLIFVADVAVKI
jgi:hypothetical protein